MRFHWHRPVRRSRPRSGGSAGQGPRYVAHADVPARSVLSAACDQWLAMGWSRPAAQGFSNGPSGPARASPCVAPSALVEWVREVAGALIDLLDGDLPASAERCFVNGEGRQPRKHHRK